MRNHVLKRDLCDNATRNRIAIVTRKYPLLVSTNVICERLSVMHYKFQLVESLVQNSLRNVCLECPPPPNKNLGKSWHFELSWSGVPPPPPPPLKIWADLGTLSLSWSGVCPTPLKMKIWADLGTLSLSWSGVLPLPPSFRELVCGD